MKRLAAERTQPDVKKFTIALTDSDAENRTSQHILTDNKIMERLIKIFRIVAIISMILTLTVAAASVIGVAITGFYPGIIVLLLLTLIPIASNFYAKKIISKSNAFQRNYYIALTIINLLTMLVVLWMTFVILVDRVFGTIL